MTIDEILHIPPYSLDRDAKRKMLNERIGELTRYHYEHCELYRKMMDAVGLDINNLPEYDELPFLPVRLFKEFELRSVPKEEIAKTMTSSGTTGQQKSQIFVDRTTSANQTKALTKIVSAFIGTHRVPMLILDTSAVIRTAIYSLPVVPESLVSRCSVVSVCMRWARTWSWTWRE